MNTSEHETADAYTVDEFCRSHRIARTKFYQLRKNGQGPRTMRLGRRVLVSREAAAEWRRQMETAQ